MVLKLIDAHGAKSGTTIMIEGEAYNVRSNDISKSGKHGASKCRIEAINVITGNKKVLACPGSTRFEVPMIEKKKAQVLSVSDSSASVMDLTSYETLDIKYLPELKESLLPEKQVEYWDIEGKKIIMRVL
ncbi:MAG TPA: translation initiation factor IF-5A [Candidatus Nanoarchaeia archaeon]|nr:translation initiation factor IF-5A [Candidatus Nanoarchaeia archaeon]